MAGAEQQTAADKASGERLRLYLLGRLDANERLGIDERLLVDHELAARIALAESELTDDYAAGRLDAVEQRAFASNFLVTSDRKRHLRFTSALQNYSRSQSATAAVSTPRSETSWRERIAALIPRRQSWAMAGAFAVVVLIAGLVWFIARQRQNSTSLIAKTIPASSPSAPPQVAASPVPTSSIPQTAPTQRPAGVPTPIEPVAPATLLSFVLLPGASRGDGELTRIAVPVGQRDVVRLGLVLETNGAGDYQAELQTAEGQSVTNLKANQGKGGAQVILNLPAQRLHRGDYQIILRRTAGGETETVAHYYFRVVK